MKRSKKLKTYFALVLAVGVALSGYFIFRPQTPDPTKRIGTAVRDKIIQRVTLAGNIEPNRTTSLVPPYEGYIQKLYVRLGQKVNKGEPMVTIAQSLNSSEETFPIRAPFSGTIVQLLKTEGQQVKPGDSKDPILRLDDLSKLFIHANAPEIDIVKVKKGQKIDIRASAILTRHYEGIVREISLAATSREQWGSRSQIEYLVKMEITNPDALLKPGMSCLIDIVTNEKPNAIALPHEFIHLDGENPFVVLKDGKKVQVKLGLQNEMNSEITEGISEGAQVRQVDFLESTEGS
jgi:multidrug efflux pump subunit AcrA (membrane-fusion protein)